MFTDLLSRRAPGQALLVSRLAVEGAAAEAEPLSPVCTAGDRGAAVLPWQLALGSWLRITSHPASQGGPLGKAVICSLCVPACIVTQSCPTLGTAARQAPLSLGFSRQEYWSGLPSPPPGNLPDPGIDPKSPGSPALALAGSSLSLYQPGSPSASFARSKCDSRFCPEVDPASPGEASLITAGERAKAV